MDYLATLSYVPYNITKYRQRVPKVFPKEKQKKNSKQIVRQSSWKCTMDMYHAADVYSSQLYKCASCLKVPLSSVEYLLQLFTPHI